MNNVKDAVIYTTTGNFVITPVEPFNVIEWFKGRGLEYIITKDDDVSGVVMFENKRIQIIIYTKAKTMEISNGQYRHYKGAISDSEYFHKKLMEGLDLPA